MINLKKLRKNKGIKLEIPNTETIVDRFFVKNLRKKLGLSQFAFSEAVGVSIKTVEKWESGKNNINGSAKKLLFLLEKHDYLIDDLYKFINENEKSNEKFEYDLTSAFIEMKFKTSKDLKVSFTVAKYPNSYYSESDGMELNKGMLYA